MKERISRGIEANDYARCVFFSLHMKFNFHAMPKLIALPEIDSSELDSDLNSKISLS